MPMKSKRIGPRSRRLLVAESVSRLEEGLSMLGIGDVMVYVSLLDGMVVNSL